MSSSERTPLLWDYNEGQVTGYPRRFGHRDLPRAKKNELGDDVHAQFCALIGCKPSNAPPDYKFRLNDKSLYGRATHLLRSQGRAYVLSASISNALLLIQVVLGAALTGLGASNSPGWLITIFGATNTVIAGLVAYLKSRGQPMRARMYRDDLERVVDEIENSEIMWLGISQGVHGYDDIDTDGEVTVRSEVARLTRLYDRAIRNNSQNNPDMYMAGQLDSSMRTGLRNAGGIPQNNIALPPVVPAPEADAAPAAPVPAPTDTAPVADDPDESPATAPQKSKDDAKEEDQPAEEGESSDSPKTAEGSGKAAETSGASSSSTAPAPVPVPVADDPDASPATKAKFTKKNSNGNSSTPKKVQGDED